MTKALGPYTLVARLGEGGMAEVFKAVKGGPHGFEKIVAIKKILPTYLDDPEMVAMFLEEAKLHATLSHPNLVQLIDFFEVDQGLALVMEYFESKPLSRILSDARKKGIRLPLPLALFIATEVLSALESVHGGEHGPIIHRDISPQNVLVSWDGWVKLADFGIAKSEVSSSKTRSGILKGKIRYLSPEQIRKERLPPASDLFSLGIVLFEMVLGRHPFPGKNEFETMQKIASGVLSIPDSTDIPKSVADLFDRALGSNPEARFSDAKTMKRALIDLRLPGMEREKLQEWIAGVYPQNDFGHVEPLSSTRVLEGDDAEPTRKSSSRHWPLAVLSILLLAAAAGGMSLSVDAPAPQPPPPAAPSSQPSGLRFELEEGASVFINGRRISFQSNEVVEMDPGRYLVLVVSKTGKKTLRTIDVRERATTWVRDLP